MAQKQKKSRKIGLIGVRKDPDFKKKPKTRSVDTSPPKKTKGKPSGSRNNLDIQSSEKTSNNAKKLDPRHGSKKPISLSAIDTVTPAKTKTKIRYATPKQELAAIEADSRLIALLDKVDNNHHLTVEQQNYVESMLARHKVLCDLLGIKDDDNDEDIDPLDSLDALSLDDFK